MFSVLPAVDLTHGRLGAYSPEGPVPVEAFGGDPWRRRARSSRRAPAGCTWSTWTWPSKERSPTPRPSSRSARRSPSVAIQASGGIRTPAEAAAFLSAGAARVRDRFGGAGGRARVRGGRRRNRRALPGRIEVVDGRIRSRGREPVDLDTHGDPGMAHGDRGTGVRGDRRRQGRLGIGFRRCHRQARGAIGKPTVAAGGIASVEDLVAVHRAGAVGAVVGRGALEGSLPLRGSPRLGRRTLDLAPPWASSPTWWTTSAERSTASRSTTRRCSRARERERPPGGSRRRCGRTRRRSSQR